MGIQTKPSTSMSTSTFFAQRQKASIEGSLFLVFKHMKTEGLRSMCKRAEKGELRSIKLRFEKRENWGDLSPREKERVAAAAERVQRLIITPDQNEAIKELIKGVLITR